MYMVQGAVCLINSLLLLTKAYLSRSLIHHSRVYGGGQFLSGYEGNLVGWCDGKLTFLCFDMCHPLQCDNPNQPYLRVMLVLLIASHQFSCASLSILTAQ